MKTMPASSPPSYIDSVQDVPMTRQQVRKTQAAALDCFALLAMTAAKRQNR
jgi:hypothetical protein